MSIFKVPQIGRRNSYITATSTRSSGAMAYDDDGRLVTSGTATEITFFGDITETKSNPVSNPLNPGRRDTRRIQIEADRKSVESITTDFTLTYDNNTDVFQVIDKYDDVHYFTAMIIAEQVR